MTFGQAASMRYKHMCTDKMYTGVYKSVYTSLERALKWNSNVQKEQNE